MLLGAALVVAVAIHPCRIELGPIVIRMHSLRNPAMLLFLGYVAWCVTFEGDGVWLRRPFEIIRDFIRQPRHHFYWAGQQIRELCGLWGWRQWAMLGLAASQALAAVLYWQGYPGYLNQQQVMMRAVYRTPSYVKDGKEFPLLEGFSRWVSEQLPPDARILFHGHTPALRFAYEVYPRRVFMLPQEMRWMAEHWHVQPQLSNIPADPPLGFWDRRLPNDTVEAADFIREHRITHVVTFDETDASVCRVEPAP